MFQNTYLRTVSRILATGLDWSFKGGVFVEYTFSFTYIADVAKATHVKDMHGRI